MRSAERRAAALITSLCLVLGAAPAALAVPPTLTGEFASANNYRELDPTLPPSFVRYTSCEVDADDNLTVAWEAEGYAGGPFGGAALPPNSLAPFEETGELTVALSDRNFGDLVALRAQFTIHSGAATIVGTKTLSDPVPGQIAECTGNERGGGPLLLLSADGLDYVAAIRTPEGEFTDRGTANFSLVDIGTTTNVGVLTEEFTSSRTAPEPACSDGLDNDRDGASDFGAGRDRGCASATDADESAFLWGRAAAGGSFSAMNRNVKRGSPYLLWYDGASVTKLRAYIDGRGATTGFQAVRGVIYRGGRLVAESEPVRIAALDTARWVDLPLAAPVELDPGYYTLGLHSGPANGVARYRWAAGPAGSRLYNIDVFADGASDPFGSAFTDNQRMSVYALGDVAAPPAQE